MNVKDIIRVNNNIHPMITAEQVNKENESHYVRNHQEIDWTEYDEQLVEQFETFVRKVYTGEASETGRPERVSERCIYKEYNLTKTRLGKMPKCKAIYDRYYETNEENWARKLVWAYNKVKSERKNGRIYWSDLRALSGVKMKNISKVLPILDRYADPDTAASIKELVE